MGRWPTVRGVTDVLWRRLSPARSRAGHPGAWGVAGERAAQRAAAGGARGSAWLAVGALLVAVVATPFGVDLGRADFGRIMDGAVSVRTDDGWRDLEAPASIPAGVDLRVGTRAARVEVPGGLLTLAEGTQLRADPGVPRLRRGSLLVEADEPLRARTGATTVEGAGEWRIDVGAASRVATYRARLDLDDGGSSRRLGPLRQVSVRDGALEPGLRPLRYTGDDPWDQWLLADALAVDRLGQRLRGSLERSYGPEPRSSDFYAAFVAVDGTDLSGLEELAVTVDDGAYGPPADVLLGVATTDALRAEGGLDAPEALERLISLRRAGGTWGLVLVEHDLGPAALRAAAERALRQVEQTPPPEPEPSPDPAPEVGDDAVTPVDDGAPQAPGPTPTADGGPTSEPAPAPGADADPPPADEGGGGPLAPVEDVVEEAGSGIGGLVEDAGRTVGDLLEGVGEGLGGTVGGLGAVLGGPNAAADDAARPDAAAGRGAPVRGKRNGDDDGEDQAAAHRTGPDAGGDGPTQDEGPDQGGGRGLLGR